MNELLGRVVDFPTAVHAREAALYGRLARDGQSPTALLIGCADSRVVPEQLLQAAPGDLFVCRNAGNIVPPHAQGEGGGVVATVEYAVEVLGVRDIVVCGHSDCGAMKGLLDPAALARVPAVAAWLRHSEAAGRVVAGSYPELDGQAAVRAAAMENVVVQLAHLRTHPAVAAGIARGLLSLHGWFVDLSAGRVLALDGESGRFLPVRDGAALPTALRPRPRIAADIVLAEAAA